MLPFPVVNQFYKAEIMTEYVIRGNTAVLKCSIPSFVADFVEVAAWIDENGKELIANDDYGKSIATFLLISFFILLATFLISISAFIFPRRKGIVINLV